MASNHCVVAYVDFHDGRQTSVLPEVPSRSSYIPWSISMGVTLYLGLQVWRITFLFGRRVAPQMNAGNSILIPYIFR